MDIFHKFQHFLNIDYHKFADNRSFFEINNFSDVSSNIFFILLGIYGFLYEKKRIEWKIFYLSIILIGLGSAYYHLNPNNNTLVWDRLPMTLGFMSFLYIFLNKHYNLDIMYLYFFILLGISSVIYWQKTNNIFFYGIVQYLPILIIIKIMYSSLNTNNSIWYAILLYGFAKISELLDHKIYKFTDKTISGHTIKHLLSALSIYYLMQF